MESNQFKESAAVLQVEKTVMLRKQSWREKRKNGYENYEMRRGKEEGKLRKEGENN